ncbi:transposase, partial [Coleofasciculus sp. E1-EBD-02]|uniref:transposase n=1 Tax=Coleofasciculus sp. E1-EBD-02 TaxID=3068481 RepID=UPI0032F539AC
NVQIFSPSSFRRFLHHSYQLGRSCGIRHPSRPSYSTFRRVLMGLDWHWLIENQLHWVKDAIFKEDKSPICHFQAVTNLSILLTIAINLFRILGFRSITNAQTWLYGRLWGLVPLLE